MTTAGLSPGSVVGDRRIDAFVDKGGMGEVYRAWNLRLKRFEAIKVILQEYAQDPSFRERFEREIEVAANLDHPNIVTIYDCDEGPEGQLLIAMRYVEGTTLEKLIRERGRLDPGVTAELIAEVGSALDAAHQAGLVHRDVKPANILVSGSEDRYRAYLTDFGLAKRLSSETVLTSAGLMVGTVDYMAPEQAQGRPVDARADIYALGATLFRALTGQVPFPRDSEVARLMAKLREAPPSASQTVPGLPEAWDPVIARALSQEPEARQRTAGELGAEALAAARPADAATPPLRLGPGAVLGECELGELIGEGGMGVVYRATQLKLDRAVAVKVMAQELADDPAFRSQFERECKIAASIDHPNVVPIYSAGEAGGRLFVVMAFVSGGSLSDILFAHGPLAPERAVEVTEQVASALDAAHARGLVHRDIKPGNILIDDRAGRVLLTDFGIAKALTDRELTGRRVLGSARYMAPERTRGDLTDEISSDIYSLGCVLWDLLGGTERPNLRGVEGVPRELAEVVGRAVDPEPSARYRTAAELAHAARQALAAGPADTSADGTSADLPARSTLHAPRQPFAPEPLSRGLAQRVLALCDEAADRPMEPQLRDQLLRVSEALKAPLQLGVVGATATERAEMLRALPAEGLGSVALTTEEHSDAFLVLVSAAGEGTGGEATMADTAAGAGEEAGTGALQVRIDGVLRAAGGSAVNSVCVLLAEQPALCQDMATELKLALGPHVAAVVPFSLRLAVAGNAKLITQEVIDRLERMADPGHSSLDGEAAAELEQLLGAEAIRAALELAGTEELTVTGLRRRLRELSGLREVMLQISGLQQRADALKAAHGLAALEDLSFRAPALAFLRDEVEVLRYQPQAHVIDLVRALERSVQEKIDLPPDLLRSLDQLVTEHTPGRRLGTDTRASGPELADAARAQRRTWKTFENGSHGSPNARRVAEAVARSLQLIAREAEQVGTSVG